MNKNDCLSLTSLLLGTFVIGLAPAGAGTAGQLDTTFGTNGVTVTGVAGANGIVNSVLLDGSGKILVYVGGDALLRYTTSGAPDATFGSNGIAVPSTPVGGSLALQTNGQIVIGGVITPSTGGAELGAVRLNANGTPDTSFGGNGVAVVSLGTRSPNVGTAVLVDPNNGHILVCTTLISAGRGLPYQTALARFNSSGALDTGFGNQGLSIQTGVNGCTALALLSTGEILVVNGRAVAQFTANGSAEGTVTGGTIVAASQTSAAFVPSIFDGNRHLFGTELFVGEESRGHNSSAQVLGFTEAGTEVINSTFHYVGTGGSGIEALVDGLAVDPKTGNIAVVGAQLTFTQSGVSTVHGLARLTPTGALDTGFGSGGIVVNNIPATIAVAVQTDSNIVTVGFASDNTTLTLARYLGN